MKDIKTAILAADVIVNEWGFQDYRLNIYGDMDKAPAYSVECKEILASKGLRDHVFLKGMGNPAEALKEAVSRGDLSPGFPRYISSDTINLRVQWIFLNSSGSARDVHPLQIASLTLCPLSPFYAGRIFTN